MDLSNGASCAKYSLRMLGRLDGCGADSAEKASLLVERVSSVLCFVGQKRDDEEEAKAKAKAALEGCVELLSMTFSWLPRACGLVCSRDLLKQCDAGEDLEQALLLGAKRCLQDDEPRVRQAAILLIGSLLSSASACSARKDAVVDAIKPQVMASISENVDTSEVERLIMQPSEKAVAVHETMGWRNLETSIEALEVLVRGHKDRFDARHLVTMATAKFLGHENRFVREAGFKLCDAIAEQFHFTSTSNSKNLVDALARGLEDNWSQVRYAASIAARTLMLSPAGKSEAIQKTLVPRMCLNRYYLAQGVRLYSRKTWKMIFPGEMDGKRAVRAHLADVVAFYVSQAKAENHAVREAACHCAAELATNIDATSLEPHVDDLVSTLLVCFRDESWTVRDAACVACGHFCLSNPERLRKVATGELSDLLFVHVSDNTWSVRENAAVSLGQLMRAYPDEMVTAVCAKLGGFLASVKSQKTAVPTNSKSEVGSIAVSEGGTTDESPALSHHAAASGNLRDLRSPFIRAAEDPEHSNKQVYSCGSLAPKLKGGEGKRRGVGCMDHGYHRPVEPWEKTDGGIYLLRELADVAPGKAEPFLADLAIAVADCFIVPHSGYRVPRFTGAETLEQTVWKQLPVIAERVGKRPFKRHLEAFLPPLAANLHLGSHLDPLTCRSASQLSYHASTTCLRLISKYLGVDIFRGRVEQSFNGSAMWSAMQPHCRN